MVINNLIYTGQNIQDTIILHICITQYSLIFFIYTILLVNIFLFICTIYTNIKNAVLHTNCIFNSNILEDK